MTNTKEIDPWKDDDDDYLACKHLCELLLKSGISILIDSKRQEIEDKRLKMES